MSSVFGWVVRDCTRKIRKGVSDFAGGISEQIQLIARRFIEQTLQKYNGHRQKTAHALGIGVRTLGMKLKRWRTEAAAT